MGEVNNSVETTSHAGLYFRRQWIEIERLLELSSRVGRDPLLVQASNGNTSVKIGGTLWIKASGKWLANAEREEILVPVSLSHIRKCMISDEEIHGDWPSCQLRPSIETAMHSVIEQRVVIHVHSVNAIAWAIRQDGRAQVETRLKGLHWQWIPYVPSGLPLAFEIEKLIRPETNVLILANHGLVICSKDCASAETILHEVEKRLAIVPRATPAADSGILNALTHNSHWRLPALQGLHTLGTDIVSLRILKGGILYPCQAIFLGDTFHSLPAGTTFSELRTIPISHSLEPIFAIVENHGVILNEKITGAEQATLMGLVQVLQRTDPAAPLRYLTADEVRSVLEFGAYQYREMAAAGG